MLYVSYVCTHPGSLLSVAAPADSVHGWGAGGGVHRLTTESQLLLRMLDTHAQINFLNVTNS